MNSLERRVNRVFRGTHRFVPIHAIRVIAESFRIGLEEAEKRPDLERRLSELEVLQDEYARTLDPAIDEKIKKIFSEDREVWAAHGLPFWESRSKGKALGGWYSIKLGDQILEIASRAEADLKWRKSQRTE